MVKIRHFLTFLPVHSSENDNDQPHLVVQLDIDKCHECHHIMKTTYDVQRRL